MFYKYFDWRCFNLLLKEVVTLKTLLSTMKTAYIIFLLPTMNDDCMAAATTDITLIFMTTVVEPLDIALSQ